MRDQMRETKGKLNDTCKTVVVEAVYKPRELEYTSARTDLILQFITTWELKRG